MYRGLAKLYQACYGFSPDRRASENAKRRFACAVVYCALKRYCAAPALALTFELCGKPWAAPCLGSEHC